MSGNTLTTLTRIDFESFYAEHLQQYTPNDLEQLLAMLNDRTKVFEHLDTERQNAIAVLYKATQRILAHRTADSPEPVNISPDADIQHEYSPSEQASFHRKIYYQGQYANARRTRDVGNIVFGLLCELIDEEHEISKDLASQKCI